MNDNKYKTEAQMATELLKVFASKGAALKVVDYMQQALPLIDIGLRDGFLRYCRNVKSEINIQSTEPKEKGSLADVFGNSYRKGNK